MRSWEAAVAACVGVRIFLPEARVVTDAEGLGEAAQLTCRGGPLAALFMTFQALD